jgi:hypothetical protein
LILHTRHRRLCLLCFSLFVTFVLGASLLFRSQFLVVGETGPRIPVRKGDVFELHYTQSMYRVPVIERYRIEEGRFVLFHVVSTAAALEYLGITSKGENNIVRTARGFIMPAASSGEHILKVDGREITLGETADEKGKVQVRLMSATLAKYLINCLEVGYGR